ncbi:S-adenosyl-L-methionine-dependent methyltransferase [Xylariales sp. PMI_506]|nr:S-adenosyl-L-methionine-dependent methyltransferase [Xylariales sp. PMI_506]
MVIEAQDGYIRTPDITPKSESGVERGFWHVPLPVLPSQILQTYWDPKSSPPQGLSPKEVAATLSQGTANCIDSGNLRPQETSTNNITSHNVDPTFATTANRMINDILDRTPTGCSVVDPQSVLGESLRLYHGYKDGKYLGPNDAAEQDRLDLQHELFRILYDGWLSLAPLTKVPEYVLDIGTGTGIWAYEFAEQNPSSYVIGVDLSAIQPPDRNISNCEFIQTDIEDEWIFSHPNPRHQTCLENGSCDHKISFDYIHLRLLFSSFNDPRIVMKHAFQNLAPGGWIEFQEAAFEML